MWQSVRHMMASIWLRCILHLLVLQLAMQKFTQKVVQMMKDENLFESQGGPIILSQVLSRETDSCALQRNIWHKFDAHIIVVSPTGWEILFCRRQNKVQ